MAHVMVDLETMSSENNGAIVAIGAFGWDDGEIQDASMVRPEQMFYRIVDLNTCLPYGLHVDPETEKWWAEQSAEARKILAPETDKVALTNALEDFAAWLPKDAEVWGYGSMFDNVLLKSAYKATGIKCPISYKRDRCYRTAKAMFPHIEIVEYGVAHNALDDAIRQGLHLQRILEHVRMAS